MLLRATEQRELVGDRPVGKLLWLAGSREAAHQEVCPLHFWPEAPGQNLTALEPHVPGKLLAVLRRGHAQMVAKHFEPSAKLPLEEALALLNACFARAEALVPAFLFKARCAVEPAVLSAVVTRSGMPLPSAALAVQASAPRQGDGELPSCRKELGQLQTVPVDQLLTALETFSRAQMSSTREPEASVTKAATWLCVWLETRYCPSLAAEVTLIPRFGCRRCQRRVLKYTYCALCKLDLCRQEMREACECCAPPWPRPSECGTSSGAGAAGKGTLETRIRSSV